MNSILKDTETRMELAFKYLHDQYASIRAGRANTAILRGITVEYYGAVTPLDQIAAISLDNSNAVVIQPWDISLLPIIEKAIQKSDIGINPQNNGRAIHLVFPPLTQDRRKEVAKEVSQLAEDTRISLRNIRRDTLSKVKALKKSSEITDDEIKKFEKTTQDLTDRFCASVDKLCKEKIAQTMEI